MKVVKFNKDFLNLFKKFLEEKISSQDYYYGIDYGYSLNRVSNGADNYLLFLNDREIVSYAIVYEEFGKTIVSFAEEKEALILLVKDTYPSYVLEGNEFSEFEKYGYFRCKFNSTFDEKSTYVHHGHFFVSDEKDIFIFRDIFENLYFPQLGDVSYELLSTNDMDDYFSSFNQSSNIFHIPLWEENLQSCSIAGFHYFSYKFGFDYPNEDTKYLVAKVDGIIVGVLEYGKSEMLNGKLVLSYVDISKKYRRNKIATNLFRELNKYIKDDVLYVTKESEMGRLCHMMDICKREVKANIVEF